MHVGCESDKAKSFNRKKNKKWFLSPGLSVFVLFFSLLLLSFSFLFNQMWKGESFLCCATKSYSTASFESFHVRWQRVKRIYFYNFFSLSFLSLCFCLSVKKKKFYFLKRKKKIAFICFVPVKRIIENCARPLHHQINLVFRKRHIWNELSWCNNHPFYFAVSLSSTYTKMLQALSVSTLF